MRLDDETEKKEQQKKEQKNQNKPRREKREKKGFDASKISNSAFRIKQK
jgi:uncharacterized protein